MAPNQVMSEVVLDGGGHFIPAGIFGVHTLSLLLTSRAAHDRATEDTHKHHTRKEHKNIIRRTLNVHKPTQGGINSVPL